MRVNLIYYVDFAKGEGSEWLEWDIELTKEEEVVYVSSSSPNKEESLTGALERAKAEILEKEKALYENPLFDSDWTITVRFKEE